MSLLAQALIETQVGRIAVINDDDGLSRIDLFANDVRYRVSQSNALTELLLEQLNCYFNKSQCEFDIPLAIKGTDFQKRVWRKLCEIPAGETWTYGQLAKTLETSARAIGGACRHNPIPIVIPCHRIVAAKGVGGYSGQWKQGKKIDIKAWLLNHEQECGQQVNHKQLKF